MKHSIWRIVFVSILYNPSVAIAEDADLVIKLSDEIAGLKTGTLNTFSLSREQIEEMGFTSLKDALEHLPFTRITGDSVGDGSIGVIDIRGFGETAQSSVKVFLNGVPLNNPTNEAPNLNFIPISSIDSIEVRVGGGSVEFGGGAVGGVVNIKTSSSELDDHVSAKASVGSFGSISSDVTGSKTIDETMSFGYSVNISSSDGYRNNTETEKKSANLELQKRASNQGIFTFSLTDATEDLNATGAASESNLAINRKSVGSSTSTLDKKTQITSIGYSSSAPDRWTANIFKRSSEQDAYFDYGPNGTSEEFSDQKTTSLGINLRKEFGFGKNRGFIVGTGLEQSSYDKTSNYLGSLTVNDRERILAGGFARLNSDFLGGQFSTGIAQQQLTDKNLSDATQYENRGTALDISYNTPTDFGGIVSVSLSRDFRFATFDENNYTTTGAPLKTQKSTAAQVTFKSDNVLVNLFQALIDDEIRYVDPSNFLNGSYDKTKRTGFEVTYSAELTDELTMTSTYSYLRATIEQGDNQGSVIPDIPENSGSVNFTWRNNDQWKHSFGLDYQGPSYALNDPGNEMQKGNESIVGFVSTGYTHGSLTLAGRINNLFNEKYDLYRIANSSLTAISRTPAEPLNFELSCKYLF